MLFLLSYNCLNCILLNFHLVSGRRGGPRIIIMMTCAMLLCIMLYLYGTFSFVSIWQHRLRDPVAIFLIWKIGFGATLVIFLMPKWILGHIFKHANRSFRVRNTWETAISILALSLPASRGLWSKTTDPALLEGYGLYGDFSFAPLSITLLFWERSYIIGLTKW